MMSFDIRRRRTASAAVVTMISAGVFATLAVAQIQTPYVDPKLGSLIGFARADIDKFWRGTIRGYVPPADVVMVQAPADTPCGKFERPNAKYIWPANKICWDVKLFTDNFALGDFAPVFILAHEWGHLVQRQLGFMSSERGLITVQRELQADCLAGTYSNDAEKRGVLEKGDDDEALMALRRGGDALNAPWFEQGAHGSPGQRFDAFLYGFEGHDCTADAFFTFLKEKGIDPSRVQQNPTADTGTLANLVPKTAGRFTLTETARIQVPGSTDAISAGFKTPDGIEVVHGIAAFANEQLANQRLDVVVAGSKKNGFMEIKRQDVVDQQKVKLGTLVVLQGSNEVVYWTNKHILTFAQAPRDIAWEFYLALPY